MQNIQPATNYTKEIPVNPYMDYQAGWDDDDTAGIRAIGLEDGKKIVSV